VLRVLFGSESMNELPRVLFSNLALMELVGFNAHQCAEGLTKRGEAARQTKKKQGPITPQCLADNISKLKQEEMERLFNQMAAKMPGFADYQRNTTRQIPKKIGLCGSPSASTCA